VSGISELTEHLFQVTVVVNIVQLSLETFALARTSQLPFPRLITSRISSISDLRFVEVLLISGVLLFLYLLIFYCHPNNWQGRSSSNPWMHSTSLNMLV